MMELALILNSIYILLAIMEIFLAPRVGPNPYFGFKIGYTFSNKEVWKKTNRFVGALMLLHSISLVPFIFFTDEYLGWFLIAFIVPLLIIAILGIVYASHKLEEINGNVPSPKVPIKPLEASFVWKHLGLIFFLILLFLMAITYNSLPDTIAVHFDSSGNPNGWANKNDFFLSYIGFSLLYLIIVYLLVYAGKRYPILLHSGIMKIGRDTVFKSSLLAFNLVVLILLFVYGAVYFYNVVPGTPSSGMIKWVVVLSLILAFSPIGYIVYRWREEKKEVVE